MLIWRILVVWFALMGVEFVQGILRGLVLAPLVGDFQSRQIGVFTGSLLILTVTCLSIRWLRADNGAQLMLTRVTWLVLTVAFELTFGHYILQAVGQTGFRL